MLATDDCIVTTGTTRNSATILRPDNEIRLDSPQPDVNPRCQGLGPASRAGFRHPGRSAAVNVYPSFG